MTREEADIYNVVFRAMQPVELSGAVALPKSDRALELFTEFMVENYGEDAEVVSFTKVDDGEADELFDTMVKISEDEANTDAPSTLQ